MKLVCELKRIRLQEYMIDSIREFANMIGVEEHTYSKWEKGITCPDLAKAYEVSKKLNKSVYDIWHPKG
jgi:DNA-binding XRE family transcriptional regulator